MPAGGVFRFAPPFVPSKDTFGVAIDIDAKTSVFCLWRCNDQTALAVHDSNRWSR